MEGLRRIEERLERAAEHVIALMLSGDLEVVLSEAASELRSEASGRGGPGGEALRSAASKLELLSQYVHALRVRYERYGPRNLYSEADYVAGVLAEVISAIRVVERPVAGARGGRGRMRG